MHKARREVVKSTSFSLAQSVNCPEKNRSTMRADFETIIKNKGKTGQMLELALGKKLDSFNIDFEDGELKSNKCDATGKPLETVFITQIASVIDELLQKKK